MAANGSSATKSRSTSFNVYWHAAVVCEVHPALPNLPSLAHSAFFGFSGAFVAAVSVAVVVVVVVVVAAGAGLAVAHLRPSAHPRSALLLVHAAPSAASAAEATPRRARAANFIVRVLFLN